MKITIIGLGLIGGSLARDLRRTGFATGLVGVESDERHAGEALKLGLVDRIASLEAALQDQEETEREAASGREKALGALKEAEAILEEARNLSAAFIVIGSHGHGAVYELLAGSTTHGVLHRAPCPVVVAQQPEDRG